MLFLTSIVVSLGKSSCAALERVIQQSEIMFRELGDDGGPGALLNLRTDYLSKKF
jgi:Ran-binding protein 9/10